MTQRCFAFGCSYTRWNWATVADFVGSNFDEYYNFGRGGACNTYIMEKLIEANTVFDFNPSRDYVVIGLTGFGRFSYFDKDKDDWEVTGDIISGNEGHPEKIKWFAKNMYNYKWAAYRSWVAVTTIKNLLRSKNIRHKIFMSIDNSHYITDSELLGLDNRTVEMVRDIYDMLDVPVTIDEMRGNDPPTFRYNDGENESHPQLHEHYAYMCRFFPEFNNKETEYMFKLLNSTIDRSSSANQTNSYKRTWLDKKRNVIDTEKFFRL